MVDLLLDLHGIHKNFGPRTPVLHDINLKLEQGSFSAIMGPSGSGKSTLLHIIGLLERPNDGSFSFLGQDMLKLTPADLTRFRAHKIGFVFQFHHLLPAFTALENVMLPMAARDGRIRKDMRQHAFELLASVGLADHAEARISELSGGQQQRVAIARALVNNPLLILADEPTGSLDTQHADEIFALLRQLNEKHGLALLIVTHDPRLAQQCNRIIEIVDGRILPPKARPG